MWWPSKLDLRLPPPDDRKTVFSLLSSSEWLEVQAAINVLEDLFARRDVLPFDETVRQAIDGAMPLVREAQQSLERITQIDPLVDKQKQNA